MKLNVCVAGATGWVGAPLCRAIVESDDLQLSGAVSRNNKGRRLDEVVDGIDQDLIVSGAVSEALQEPTDVLVDYTEPGVVKQHTLEAIERRVHVVIGTSGLTDDDFAEIDRAADNKGVGVIAAGNFAITAVLLQHFACEAAKYLSQWEIIDYSADKKPDAPSGTVRELVYRLSEIRQPELTIPVEKTIGEKATRGATMNGMQVHSIRVPGFMIGAEAIFGAENERLSIRYDGGAGAEPYIGGTLLAIRKVRETVGLVRGLDRIMEK